MQKAFVKKYVLLRKGWLKKEGYSGKLIFQEKIQKTVLKQKDYYGDYLLKGYLRYQAINSQNMSSEARVKKIFNFVEKVMLRSQDIKVFVFLTIPWFTKSVTSWWVLVHKTGCIFEYIFWATTH